MYLKQVMNKMQNDIGYFAHSVFQHLQSIIYSVQPARHTKK